jgi:hypothetical protein
MSATCAVCGAKAGNKCARLPHLPCVEPKEPPP